MEAVPRDTARLIFEPLREATMSGPGLLVEKMDRSRDGRYRVRLICYLRIDEMRKEDYAAEIEEAEKKFELIQRVSVPIKLLAAYNKSDSDGNSVDKPSIVHFDQVQELDENTKW